MVTRGADSGAEKTTRRKLSRTTIQSPLNLLRCCLAHALDRRIIVENPAEGVRLERRVGGTEDPWTYRTADEQARIIAAPGITDVERAIVLFALGTGLRQGEQWNLELRDLHVDGPEPYVHVRFGSKGLPPKNGKQRRVPLFGIGLDAARAWLALLPEYTKEHGNPEGLAFPSPRGCRRQKSKAPKSWPLVLKAAGIERRVRWHDLRHSCASSLVSGAWGHRWTLEEVKGLLGHQSITTTERYAHLLPSALTAAAAATPALRQGNDSHGDLTIENHGAPPARIGRATFGLGNRCSIH